MRKTLFRGKPVKPIDLDALPEYHKWVKDGWIYGYLIGKDVIVGEIVDFEEGYLKTEFLCKVKPETVGQYTGLKNKRGVKICEGDIIQAKELTWVVEPVSSLERDGTSWGLCVSPYGNGDCYFIDDSILNGDVIGNIWDNPELLEA